MLLEDNKAHLVIISISVTQILQPMLVMRRRKEAQQGHCMAASVRPCHFIITDHRHTHNITHIYISIFFWAPLRFDSQVSPYTIHMQPHIVVLFTNNQWCSPLRPWRAAPCWTLGVTLRRLWLLLGLNCVATERQMGPVGQALLTSFSLSLSKCQGPARSNTITTII